ncbi:hypothetical protein ACHAPE_003168 [Trichoderma viride]
MAHLTLVKEFPAMEPQMTFRAMSYKQFHNTWSEPIDTIRRATIALTEDIAMFQAMGFHKRHTEAAEEFLKSLLYYSQVLIWGSLVKIKGRLRDYTPTPALPIDPTFQPIGSRVTDAEDAFDRFSAVTSEVLNEASWTLRWKTPKAGDKVPTASPYQLLYQLICVEKMASAPPDRTTRDLLSTENRSRVVFGANQTSRGRLPAVHAITRKARDIRLQVYIPLALRAFQALRRKEEKELGYLPTRPGNSCSWQEGTPI